jgi:hypothetical protein
LHGLLGHQDSGSEGMCQGERGQEGHQGNREDMADALLWPRRKPRMSNLAGTPLHAKEQLGEDAA